MKMLEALIEHVLDDLGPGIYTIRILTDAVNGKMRYLDGALIMSQTSSNKIRASNTQGDSMATLKDHHCGRLSHDHLQDLLRSQAGVCDSQLL